MRPPRRERSSGSSAPRRSGRKVLLGLALLASAGVGYAMMGNGGVIESRGVAGEPSREAVRPVKRIRPVRTPIIEPSVDSIAAVVRDSVALLIGTPPVDSSPETTTSPAVPSERRGEDRGAPFGRATAPPNDASLPSVDLRRVGVDVPNSDAARTRTPLDSATRQRAAPTFDSRSSTTQP
jgi:hypothetical protein